eukprot:scaffold650018_cov45-Prasinocladus_malaysianus.AAC.1
MWACPEVALEDDCAQDAVCEGLQGDEGVQVGLLEGCVLVAPQALALHALHLPDGLVDVLQ